MKNTLNSKVCVIANSLIRQGVNRSAAFIRAWITVKIRNIKTRTAGVTVGKRQGLLDRLNRYAPEDITIKLRREPFNAYDRNAVQVIAAVRGKGSAVMGYLNRELAAAIAPLLDKGKEVISRFGAITGGHERFLNYGLNIELSL